MGWSWALHVCTDALEHAVCITGTGRDQARERCAAPLMTVAEPVCSRYVDNITMCVAFPLRVVIVGMK